MQIAFLTISFLGVFLPIIAAITGNHRTAYVAAALSLPICFYAAGLPIFYFIPLTFPFLTVAGGKLLTTRRTLALWLLFSPHFISVILLAKSYIVAN
jgi:hypothetical protein